MIRDFPPVIACSAIRRVARVGDAIVLLVQQDAFGGAVKIIVLAAPQRPEKGCQGDPTQEKRQRHEKNEATHTPGRTL